MRRTIVIILISLISTLIGYGKPTQKWLDQKYSMFIHFGLYSQYGGVYQGEPVKWGYSEQIQSFAGIFSDWYAASAEDFNPEEWDPDSIVELAKEAGMKSIVFTSKHHDGFCMYHSQFTSFNIVDATPYGRDLMKELADACHRGGIDFGIYYSLIDWHFPQAYPISSHNADPLTPEHFEYNMKQVREIMTNYGTISEIWFDMGCLTPEQSKKLYHLVNDLQPECMISGRLGNDYVDFSVMADNEYPDYKLGVPWQTAASMFDETWGYRSWQERGSVSDKINEKIKSIIKVVSRGGNYLLNIGPRGDGSVVDFERDVLLGIGQWIGRNKEAIYGTRANPFHQFFGWGDVTATDDALYLFIEEPTIKDELSLCGFDGVVREVVRLEDGQPCHFVESEGGIIINCDGLNQQHATPFVIKVSFENGYTVRPEHILQGGELSHLNAIHTFGHSSQDYYGGYKSLIGYDWYFSSSESSITPTVYYAESDTDKTISINIDGTEQIVQLTGSIYEHKELDSQKVKWGGLYTKRGRGVFGYLPEEGTIISPETLNQEWEQVEHFRYGEEHQKRLRPRGSILFLQEIKSSEDQTIAVKLGCGNAMYVTLNGEYITAHFSPDRISYQEELLLLPLKAGNNQLIVKYFNRFENDLKYSITPLKSWDIYAQPLKTIPLKDSDESHRISLRLAHPSSKVSPLRLSNLSIKL